MCAVPWAAAGRGKRNNYFSDPQGNIKKKEKEKKMEKKLKWNISAGQKKKNNEEVERKKITV